MNKIRKISNLKGGMVNQKGGMVNSGIWKGGMVKGGMGDRRPYMTHCAQVVLGSHSGTEIMI